MNLLKHWTRCLFGILLLGLSTLQLQAQTDTIPLTEGNNEKLLEEITAILSYQNQQEPLEILATYKKNIKERRITDQHNAALISLGNEMIRRKMKRFNFFKYIVGTLNSFAADNTLSSKYLDQWVQVSIDILKDQPDGKTAAYENYLKFATYFWANGNFYQASFSGGGHVWRAESKDFALKYKDKELTIKYENTNIYAYNRSDSLILQQVRGTYYPLTETFKVDRARVEWKQDGAMDAFCDMKDFSINTRVVEYKCENATLNYPSIFKKTIDGKVSDRATRRKATNMIYPQFESKSRDIKIDDIGEGVSYEGGFVMRGSVVRGYGDDKGKSTIYIHDRANKRIVRAVASDFDIIKGERVVSADAEVSIYFQTETGIDSIYHPSTNILYNIKTRELELTRGEAQASKVPFFNSYQQMEMNLPRIKWKIDSTKIDLGDDNQDASFDSETFFDKRIFERYQPNTTYNYIILLAVYSQKLQQYKEELKSKPDCAVSEAKKGQEAVDESFCTFYPEACAEDPATGKIVPKERLEVDTTQTAEPKPKDEDDFDPLEIHVNTLARLFDKRVEGRAFLTPCEFKEQERRMKEKFGENYKKTPAFKDFAKKNLDITQLVKETTKPAPNHNLSNTRRLFLDMVSDGLVVFNNDDTLVNLRPKLFHYSKSSNIKSNDHDYDNLRITSVPGIKNKSNKNASLDLTTGGIDVGKVQKFVLSESQQVIAQLDAGGNNVTLKKGRDMDFAGDIYAGFFQFTGRDFHFSYSNFEVYMDSIDVIFVRLYKRFLFSEIMSEEELKERPELIGRYSNIRYYDMEDDGTKKYSTEKVMLNSYISNTKGLLKIDQSNNKSGRQKSSADLPFFDTGENAGGYIYYNDAVNKQGQDAYPRDSFYYELEKFYRDSLDVFEPVGWKLKGRFVSANILPIVAEPLRIMFHDLSFGFEMETPTKDGFPIYIRNDKNKGKGNFTGIFGVSNEGLIGKGRINYLGAKIESDYIVFLPERFKAENVDSFNLERSTTDGVEYPKIAGMDVEIDWAPYSDSMYIESNITDGVPFKVFDSGAYTLDGSLILTPSGLLGRGTFDWDEGTLTSNPGGDFAFGSNSVKSASTAAIIKSTGLKEFAFQNDNVEAVVDFDKRIGDFISNEKDLSTDLPYNNYKTSLDRFHWEMDKQKLLIESTQGKAGFFLATEQSQDSLFFLGEKADYDLNTGLLQIDGVDYIRVADAFIYPKDRHVEIEEQAHMRTLTDSKVVADTSNQNHVIQRATINVLSRREYNADGFLEFGVEGHKDQEIQFSNVRVEQTGTNQFTTKGSGVVEEKAEFYVDKLTRFRGDVSLSADSKDLQFKGYAKLTSKVLPSQDWFAIDSKIDKKQVAISYNEPQSPDGFTMHVGLYLDTDIGNLYPCIMAPKTNVSDRSIFSTIGVVHYDPKLDMYLFGDSAKVFSDTMVGKKVTVSEKTSKVTAEGRFDFQQGFSKPKLPFVGVDGIGDFSFFLNKKSDFRFDMALNIDFPLPSKTVDFITRELLASPDIVEPILYTSVNNARFKRYLYEFINDDKKFEKTWKKVEDDNRLNLPSDFSHQFFFSKLTLTWSEKTQSFISVGNLQLASVGGKNIGQVVQGGVEIMPDPLKGDVLNFYIVAPNGEWFFFTYQGGIVRTASSKEAYQNELIAIKKKDRNIKTKNGESIEVDISNAGEYGNVKNRVTDR